MTLRSHRFSHAHRIKASQWAVALALGVSVAGITQAATVGHSRVLSASGAPLQVVVPLENVTADELASLKVSLASGAAWQRAGLQPPVALDTIRISVQDGLQANSKTIRVVSSQPLATSAVDLLLDLQSSTGHRQVQVTILVPQRASAAPVQSARVGAGRTSQVASGGTVTVRPGDTLFRIAGRNRVADADVYQMLVALWRANPQAFIRNNMNLVRAGETLTVPDAASVRAVSATEARRIYVEQAEAFARYRGRAGSAVSASAAVDAGVNGDAGQVSTATATSGRADAPAQDRLRLRAADAAEEKADAQADARTAEQRALEDARQRVDTLQGNVDALSQAAADVAGSGANQSGAGSASGQTGASSGGAGAASGDGGVVAAGTDGSDTTGSTTTAGRSSGMTGAGAASGGAAGSAADPAGANASDAAGGGASSSIAGASASTAAGSGGDGGPAVDASRSEGERESGSGATSSADSGPGSAGANAVGGISGSSDATGGAVGGPNNVAGSEAAAQDLAAASGNATTNAPNTTGNWLIDNLLVLVTGILALIVLIIAWLLRRAGIRRADENEDDVPLDGEQAFDATLVARKLDGIDLDLDTPPTDEPSGRTPRV